jgi:hypothetical protein
MALPGNAPYFYIVLLTGSGSGRSLFCTILSTVQYLHSNLADHVPFVRVRTGCIIIILCMCFMIRPNGAEAYIFRPSALVSAPSSEYIYVLYSGGRKLGISTGTGRCKPKGQEFIKIKLTETMK